MATATQAIVKIGNTSVELRFDACRMLLGGEFAGNIELDIACDKDVIGAVVDSLRVQLPGETRSDTALGNGHYGPGIHLVYGTDSADLPTSPPESITLLWGETPIATIAPSFPDIAPIAQHVTWIEPTQILDSLPVRTSNHVLLYAHRQKLWLLLAALEVASGVAFALALPGLEIGSAMLGWIVGGTMIAGGLGIGVVLAGVPSRQFWLDRDRGRVLIIEGRTRNPQARFADAPSRPLDEFDHVRLYQRWHIGHGADDHDQEIWYVTLEAEIPFSSGDGMVHLHSDALPIAESSSETHARRIAAEVGFHTGLRIRDTGHDLTA